MPVIRLETNIKAGIGVVFDLSRSIDLHTISTARTNEKAVAGITTGLIAGGEWVTWEARHFGIVQRLTSKITAYERPFHFRDEQVQGIFKSIKHDHYFEQKEGFVLMTDVFVFNTPLGILGRLFNCLVLTRYLRQFLAERNAIIREYAEQSPEQLPGVFSS